MEIEILSVLNGQKRQQASKQEQYLLAHYVPDVQLYGKGKHYEFPPDLLFVSSCQFFLTQKSYK